MVTRFVTSLHAPISQIRLESYRPQGAPDEVMLANYFWDIELARAITPALHAVEVALRNTIHETLSNHYTTDMWFYRPQVLEPGQLSQLANALSAISKRRAQPTSGRIVAELNFGFWVTLLSSNYERPIWQPNRFALLRQAFPNATGESRQSIQQHFNNIRTLRNRVSHYEAIWDLPNLAQDFAKILTAIQWISQDFHNAINTMSEFTNVYANGNGHQLVLARLRAGLGI